MWSPPGIPPTLFSATRLPRTTVRLKAAKGGYFLAGLRNNRRFIVSGTALTSEYDCNVVSPGNLSHIIVSAGFRPEIRTFA